MEPAEIPEKPHGDNSHVLWKQLAGLIFWVGLFSFSAQGLIGLVVGLAFGGLTFADAWLAGIRKDKSQKSFLNISPMAWGIVVPLLFIVGFPAYAINRNKLKTLPGNGVLFGFVLAVGSFVVLSFLYSIYQAVSVN
jgi:hypothetical protein